MKKDLFQNSAAVYAARRKNKSIWFRGCMLVALVVVLLTGYALIFPARTVEKELICSRPEHVHTESCYLSALTCGLEENEAHTHTEACYTTVLTCGMEEHVHTEECYAEPEPERTEAATEPGEDPTAPAAEPEQTETPVACTEQQSDAQPAVPEETNAPVMTVGTKPGDLNELLREFPDDGIDLAPYLDSAIFQRQVDGAFVEDTWFENGETVKGAIIYDIPAEIVTAEKRYVFYQLPEGIRPIEETSGEVISNGASVGVYTINEDGIIHIRFNEEFANGSAIMGTVEFSCYVYANEDGTDREIEFENDAGTITVTVPDEQKYDLNLEKTGSFNESYSKAEFVLLVRTDKGSGAPITVTDQLTNQTPATLLSATYDRAGLTVRRVDAEGAVTLLTGCEVDWAEDGMRFTVENLPELGPGERYEISYTVDLSPDLSGSFELDNEATAVAGQMEATTSFFITYTCDITKSGTFNPTTGLIDWVITVNPESRPVAGWRIEDDLPYPAVGKVLLTNANGVRYADLTPADGRTIRYTFPPNAPARPFFIRYSTVAPVGAETVRNAVRLINERETTVVSEVTVDERIEGVDKTLGAKHVYPDGMIQTLWSFRITLPVGELERYSFRDVISTSVFDVNRVTDLDRTLHFAYAAELDQALRGNLRLISDGVSYYYGDEDNDYVSIVPTYYDAAGNPVDPEDRETHVAHVAFSVTPLAGNSFHGYELVAEDYPTWLDATGARELDYWSYQNHVYLQGGSYDFALSFYRKGNTFRKQVKANGSYTSDDADVAYTDCSGVLDYRLLIDLTALVDDTLTVTDVLPAGVELVSDSFRMFYTGVNLNGEYAGTFSDPNTVACTAAPGEDGTTVLTFSANGITERMKQTYAYIGIVYSVRLNDDTLWNDYTHTVKSFTNTAAWEDYTASQTTTVEKQAKRLEKTGEQLLDQEGGPLGRVRFQLVINAGAEDLDPESDQITLTDEFSSAIGANLELGSVRLYCYDPSRPDHIGNRVMNYEFSLSYDTAAKALTVRLKDETAYVLVYDYTVDYTSIVDGQTVVANNAMLAGQYTSGTQIALRGVSSSATAWQRSVIVTKVDEDNNAKVLPGASFLLEYWDPALGVWDRREDPANPEQIFVTNASGKIVLSLIGADASLTEGRLYRLTEVQAPPGYETNNAVVWLLCMPRTGRSREAIFADAGFGSEVDFEQVSFFGLNGGNIVVPNPFNGLTVHKRWFNYAGEEMDGAKQAPITVTLYCSADPTGETGKVPVPESETVENPVRLGTDNGWTYTWGGLPARDGDGNPLYYFAEETPVPGFTPSYINNGITGGAIVISNCCEPYELPETGGCGSCQFVEFGIMLMLAAAVAYIKIKKMEETQ